MVDNLSVNVSWLGIIIGAVALFILGGVWYVPLFGKVYRRELGLSEARQGESPLPPGKTLGKALAGQFIASLAIAGLLAWLIGNESAGHGAIVGLVGGVLVAAALTQLYQFEGKTVRHLLINIGFVVIGLTAVGAILGAFQAA